MYVMYVRVCVQLSHFLNKFLRKSLNPTSKSENQSQI